MAVDTERPSVQATLQDAERLFQDKLQDVQKQIGAAERLQRDAVTQKDKALGEVTTLRGEKDSLMKQLQDARAEKQRITDSLAEHRKNVEASLAKQEARANEAISKASKLDADLEDKRRAVEQFRSQVIGVKQTLEKELAGKLSEVAALGEKLLAALKEIPETFKQTKG